MIRLEVIKNALLGISSNVYHYAAPPNQTPPYIVWGEDGAHDFVAGNKHMEQAYQGTLDDSGKRPAYDIYPKRAE